MSHPLMQFQDHIFPKQYQILPGFSVFFGIYNDNIFMNVVDIGIDENIKKIYYMLILVINTTKYLKDKELILFNFNLLFTLLIILNILFVLIIVQLLFKQY